MAEKQHAETPQEQTSQVSRRDLFQIIGTVPALAAITSAQVAAQTYEGHAHLEANATPSVQEPYQRKTFDNHQWQTVCVLCDLIIPADERSGSATQAGVPEFLDDWIAFRTEQDENEDLEAEIFGGLMWLDRQSHQLFEKDFAAASADQQKQVLDRVAHPAKASSEDRPWAHFFSTFRSLTVGGFFSSKMGVADLPYLGNRFVPHWKGCDPKVWAILEERMKTGYKGIVESKPWSDAAQS